MQVLLLFLVSQVNLPTKYLKQYDLLSQKQNTAILKKFTLTDTCNQYQVKIVINISAASIKTKWAGIVQMQYQLATGWTVRGSNPRGKRDFSHLYRPALVPTQPHIQ